jgi:hypothetical protein
MYDVKKQLAAMTLTLRNVAVLDTKARSPAGTHNTPSVHIHCTCFSNHAHLFPARFQIDNFDASLTRMIKYLLSSPQVGEITLRRMKRSPLRECHAAAGVDGQHRERSAHAFQQVGFAHALGCCQGQQRPEVAAHAHARLVFSVSVMRRLSRVKHLEEERSAAQAEQSNALLDAVHSDALLFD